RATRHERQCTHGFFYEPQEVLRGAKPHLDPIMKALRISISPKRVIADRRKLMSILPAKPFATMAAPACRPRTVKERIVTHQSGNLSIRNQSAHVLLVRTLEVGVVHAKLLGFVCREVEGISCSNVDHAPIVQEFALKLPFRRGL